MKTPDEKQGALLRRAIRGDEQAFLALYQKHQSALYRYALRMTGSPWAAEEVVQEVFLVLIREPQKYQAERGELGAFLFGVARNRVMKHLEKTPRETSLDVINTDGSFWREPEDPLTPMTIAEKRERMEQVREAVLGLPAEFREAVVLCELEEMSYEEAARACGCPIGTIRSRLHRGRALLLAKLELLRDAAPRRASAGAK
jgi:RNA polymerase sigma-70 factor (ECF subfamily)